MSAIGGYFELELQDNKSIYHNNAIAVNTGRNALEYILRTNKKISKVFLPYYTCDVLLQPIKRLNLQVAFYRLDEELLPKLNLVGKNEAIVYVNYFGIMNKKIKKILSRYENLIIDNSQAFFARPIKNIPTFFSPRKFFGLPDGGFAYTNKIIKNKLEPDNSLDRISHLLGRIEKGAESFFPMFKENDKKLDNLPLKRMSNLTLRLMRNINFKEAKHRRNKNFNLLHNSLKKINELSPLIDNGIVDGPMVYPFLIKGGKKLKKHLIKNKIYVATYWPNVYQWVDKKDWEYYLTDNLIPLPIDQRYSPNDMKRIIKVING
ncbi:MAG: hypothetical protein KatS3mg096_893 [Candidatus Parcubacteria bacterium]|nr:MAG: hypothetical protein KatS3mg096_893 [Candidatus Parcubacteria bacterium]